MKILLVSDLHYAMKQLDWVVARAGDYDLVVLAGDHLDLAGRAEPDAQIAVVLAYLARIAEKTTVIASSGNHDLNVRNSEGERVAGWLDAARAEGVYVDWSRVETDDVLVTVCPWWDGPLTRERVDRQLAEDAARVGDRLWVWVYHAPPDQSPTSWTGVRHYGDTDLVEWIAQHQPGLVLCGHVHQSPWVSDPGWIDHIGATAVLNAGRQSGAVPSWIELDTDTGDARWVAADAREERSFAPV